MGVALSKFLFLLAIFAFDKVHLAGGGILKQVSKQPVSECPPQKILKGVERQIKRPVSGTAENDKNRVCLLGWLG